MSDQMKAKAAAAALEEVKGGMRLGLGTGSTAEHFVRLLGPRVRAGLDVVGVPTSERTAALARSEGIRLATLEELPELDLTVDGADELDSELALIKGGGGALLREKIVASASARMIVIADASKKVETLGAFPLPIEVVPFGLGATRRAIAKVLEELGYTPRLSLRGGDASPYVTDGHHHILDADLRQIGAPRALSDALLRIPGVVEHGLFLGLAAAAYIAGDAGVEKVEPRR
ncbi:ribose-5-phosphate isomerase RpiA [Stappia sp. F7233]|uniref:Ribose-5-phosphate isomerase A n=1 Tax=Stappia albiluteola TaxID=2758565 RepID=A0A839AK03_9HYPH|nr:ribose-5-phosphate isomerase RpiA [Stappia albiluteola]MBA5779358.1 ribose-5-phosphate isomerase RpiA [Stappia albiluteola]